MSVVQGEGNVVYSVVCLGFRVRENVVYSDVCLRYRVREMLCTAMCV